MKFPALPAVFRCLIETLTGPDYALRRAALTALSRLRGDAAAEVLFERFESDNLDDFLACAISRLNPDKAAKLFLQALHDSHVEVRLAAADALSRLNSDEAVQVLNDAVEKYLAGSTSGSEAVLLSEEAVSGAIRALARLGTPICIALLRKLLLKEQNPRIRATIIAAIIPRMNDSMLSLIAGYLKDDDSRVRANAIEAIQALKNPSIIAVLQPYLYDPHQRVRANAIKAVWQYGDFEVSATLKEMLGAKDKCQRVSGIYAVGEIRLAAFQKQVLAGLRDEDPDIRRNAVIAIRKLFTGNREKAPATLLDSLQPLLDDQDAAVRLQVVLALEGIMGEECNALLVKRLLIEKAAGVLSQLIESLGRFRRPETLGIIDPYLDDAEAQVVIAVLGVIAGTGAAGATSATIGSVRRCMQHADLKVRRKTVETLWILGTADILNELAAGLNQPEPDVRKAFLQCFGDVCALVSEAGGETLSAFQDELKAAVARHREKLERSRHTADEADAQVIWNKAVADVQAGRNGEAVASLEKLVKLAPRHLQGWMTLGDLAQRGGDHGRAMTCYRTVLALQPNLPKAHYALGQIHHAKGAWKEAADALQTAIRLYPKLPQAYLLMAEALEALQRPDDAFKALQGLAALMPDNGGVLQRLARAAFLAGDPVTALDAAKKASKMGQLDFAGHFIISYGMYSEGNGASAYRDLVVLAAKAMEQPGSRTAAEFQKLLQAAVKLLRARSGTA